MSILLALLVVVVGAVSLGGKSAAMAILSLTVLTGFGLVVWYRQSSVVTKAKTELTSGEEYRRLAEECRRLADMAITAQEHTDLRLSEVNVQMDMMRTQLESVARILADVE